MHPDMKAIEAYKAEEQRQTQLLYDAMNTAMKNVGVGLDLPMLNAVAGAVAMMEAEVLSACPVGKHRKDMLGMIERARKRALRDLADRKPAQIVEIGRPASA